MTIAESGSVSAAAEKLRLGQPTLSSQLKQFEENIGVQLFDRKHKRLILTEQGQVALQYAKNIFQLGSEMFEALQDQKHPQKTLLQVGSQDSIAKSITLNLTQAAHQHAGCQISLLEGKPDFILHELLSYHLDLLLMDFVPNTVDTKSLIYKSLGKFPLYIYGSAKYLSLKGSSPISLSKNPIILPTFDSRMRFDIEHWARDRKMSLNVVAETQDTSLKLLMAIDGMGLVPAQRHTVAKELQLGSLIEIGPLDGIYQEIFIISAQRKVANPIAKHLFETFELLS